MEEQQQLTGPQEQPSEQQRTVVSVTSPIHAVGGIPAPQFDPTPVLPFYSQPAEPGRPWYEWLGIQRIETVEEQATRTKQQCRKKERSTARTITRLEEDEKVLGNKAKMAAKNGDQAKMKNLVRQIALKRKQKMRLERVGETNARMGAAVDDFQSQAEIGQNVQVMSRMMGKMASSQSIQRTMEMQKQFKQNDAMFRKNAEILDKMWDDDREEEGEFESEFIEQIMLEHGLVQMEQLSLLKAPIGRVPTVAPAMFSPQEQPLLELEGMPNVQQFQAATSGASVEVGSYEDLVARFNALSAK